MTEYEQNEVRDYPEVYFTGPLAEKVPASLLHVESNHGFDDERGDYAIVAQGQRDRYNLKSPL